MSQAVVQTVLGPVRADGLGIILPHEHFPSYRGVWEGSEPPAGYLAELERLQRGVIREAQGYGVGTMVEVTPIGSLRAVPMMQRLSRETGIQVVASTGLYLAGRRPEWVREKSAEELADLFTREVTESMTDTNARAGMIKVAGDDLAECEEDRKVFRAAALASKATGAAITTHSCNRIGAHFDFLVEAGADPGRLYIGHADFGEDDSDHLRIARAGGHLIFTCWGIEHFVDQEVLAKRVVALVEAGLPEAVLLSIDYALVVADNRMDLISMEYECPRRTPAFLFRYALPKLREHGVGEDLIRRFTADNPREMLIRAGRGAAARAGVKARPVTIRSGMEVKPFSPETEADAQRLVNAYTAGWRYSRPIGPELTAHWKTLGRAYQPQHMLVAYRDGEPRAFLHGEAEGGRHYAHLLAMAPGAVEEGVWLLGKAEEQARGQGARRVCGPTCESGRFYGGYLLGLEPYHPHWATDGTEAYVQAGFEITQPEVLLAAEGPASRAAPELPRGYEVVETDARREFLARSFRLAVLFRGREVASCGARLYPSLTAPTGGTVGQLGPVVTDERHRNRGLATALVGLAMGRLLGWGAAVVLVSTGLDNKAALRVYERAGFRRRHAVSEWSKALG